MKTSHIKQIFDLEYEVEDGYVGPAAPHTIRVNLDEFYGDEDLADIEIYLRDSIREDFEQRISWRSKNLEEIAKQIHENLQRESNA